MTLQVSDSFKVRYVFVALRKGKQNLEEKCTVQVHLTTERKMAIPALGVLTFIDISAF